MSISTKRKQSPFLKLPSQQQHQHLMQPPKPRRGFVVWDGQHQRNHPRIALTLKKALPVHLGPFVFSHLSMAVSAVVLPFVRFTHATNPKRVYLNTFFLHLLVFIASGAVLLLQEWRLDHDYTRFALLSTSPFLVCVSLVKFFFSWWFDKL